jgi:predicted site-specific integrase-resolvase
MFGEGLETLLRSGISASDQRTDLQQDALAVASCEKVLTDTASAAKVERSGLF